jgi:hypothetical protein
MAALSAFDFSAMDIFIDYGFEDVKFRWDHKARQVYRRFYGQAREERIPFNNRLFTDALASGNRITEEEYRAD